MTDDSKPGLSRLFADAKPTLALFEASCQRRCAIINRSASSGLSTLGRHPWSSRDAGAELLKVVVLNASQAPSEATRQNGAGNMYTEKYAYFFRTAPTVTL